VHIYIVHKRETSNALYALIRSEQKRSQMLSKCILVNSRIALVSGKEFYTDGPTAEKACWAVVLTRQRETIRMGEIFNVRPMNARPRRLEVRSQKTQQRNWRLSRYVVRAVDFCLLQVMFLTPSSANSLYVLSKSMNA